MGPVATAVPQRLEDQFALDIGDSTPDERRRLRAVRFVPTWGRRPRRMRTRWKQLSFNMAPTVHLHATPVNAGTTNGDRDKLQPQLLQARTIASIFQRRIRDETGGVPGERWLRSLQPHHADVPLRQLRDEMRDAGVAQSHARQIARDRPPDQAAAGILIQWSNLESQSAIGGSGDVRAAAEAHGTIGAGNVGHDETHKLPSFPKAVLRASWLTER